MEDLGFSLHAIRVQAGAVLILMLLGAAGVRAAVLWSDPGATLIFDSGPGRDILQGALKRDDTSSDTLYFRFHVDPLSDSTTEEYFAAFQLFEGEEARVGIGNAPAAWAYSAFFGAAETKRSEGLVQYVDLHSSAVGAGGGGTIVNNELPRRGAARTLVFKVQYIPGGEDLITVWLNPDLSAGVTETLQPESLTTRFNANASFDEIRLRHGGGGEGWVFSDMAIATSFADFVDPSSSMPRTAGSGPLFDLQPFSFQSWLREPGMPRSGVQALAQTTDGYLWLAAGDQMARFDGVRFVALDVPALMGGGTVRTLFGDAEGALWIGTDRGLVRHLHGRFKTYTTDQGLPNNTVTAIQEDGQGKVWIGTTAGLRVWSQGELGPVAGAEAFEGRAVNALCLDAQGTLWLGVQGMGVYQHQGGDFARVTDDEFDGVLRDPQCLFVDRQARVWIGAGDDAVLCRDGGGWHRYRIPRHSQGPQVRALREDSDGTVWAASGSEGLFQFKQGKLVSINSRAGLLDNHALALLLDRTGNLWVGSESGLHLLSYERCFKLGQAEGLGSGPVASVAEVAPGVIWAVQPGRGLYRWEGRVFRRLRAAGLEPGDPLVGPLLVTRGGACWMGCTNGLLLFRDPQAVADESLLFDLPEAQITALAEAPDGSIWAGTRQGRLWRLHRGEWSKRLQLDSPVAISALAVDPAGSVWAATDGEGLYRVDDSGPVRFGSGNGLPADTVRALQLDRQGVLWLGMAGGGLVRSSNSVFTSYTFQEGLSDKTILGILEDRLGRFWLHDSSGLTCIAKPSSPGRALEVLGVFPKAAVRAGENPSGTTGSPVFPKGCSTPSGRLWFATLDGILVVEPPDYVTAVTPPVLILEAVLVDGMPAEGFQPITASNGLRPPAFHIKAGRHRVELQYTSPCFGAPEPPQFRYRMEGLDQDWVEAGTSRAALYNYLPPGDYQFVVALAGQNGRSSQIRLGLSVAHYFWQRWWVIATMTVGLVAAILGSARFVEKRKLKRQFLQLEQERFLERERTRIAQDLHDEMGAKLCRISFLSEYAGRLEPASPELKEQIASIAGDSRDLLNSLDEIVWVVNPKNDTLEHVASYLGQYAQNYFHGTGIECEMDFPSQLPEVPVPSQARHHLFLAVHEALTNILKHSGATHVKVSIACLDSRLHIKVEDNGSGFRLPDAPAPVAPGDEPGNGLVNMQERMQNIGGRCRMESAPGRGATVEFMLELNASQPNPARP